MGPVPELAQRLGLEHHQCARLLKAVYGLVNAFRAWWLRVKADVASLSFTGQRDGAVLLGRPQPEGPWKASTRGAPYSAAW